MFITRDIQYVGVNDHEIDLFEGQYIVPNGMAYNSYVILDERIAVMDTVDARFGEEWLSNVRRVLDGRTPDYLVVEHMEPDHSSNITAFMQAFPSATVVSCERSFLLMKQFFGSDYPERRMVIGDGSTLSLGKHVLQFISAPMVHWPEVTVAYDAYDKVLFSADAFGKFGALDVEEDWACEARRYYFGIVGKYGAQAQRLLARAAELDIRIICPLHGPALSERLEEYIGLYRTWTSYGVESEGIVIAYTSVYGNTRKAVETLAEELRAQGKRVTVTDLARDDMAEAVEDAFRYGTLVLATTTYNGDIFPFMREFLHELTERGYCNRRIAMIENGSWAPVAAKKMRAMLEGSKGISFAEPTVTIRSAMSDENRAQIKALAQAL